MQLLYGSFVLMFFVIVGGNQILTYANALGYTSPTLSPSDNQTIINVALTVPGIETWSHDWKYIHTSFLGNNKAGTPDFKWQYAIVDLKAPSSSAPVACDKDWEAEVTVDITTKKVVSASYPTMESHNCDNVILGSGPRFYNFSAAIHTPLKQFNSGIAANNVICKQDLKLIFKAENGSPACVKPDTINVLIERGWAKSV